MKSELDNDDDDKTKPFLKNWLDRDLNRGLILRREKGASPRLYKERDNLERGRRKKL